jgi:hypothetical protein
VFAEKLLHQLKFLLKKESFIGFNNEINDIEDYLMTKFKIK